jgi:subtilisin family serine protease
MVRQVLGVLAVMVLECFVPSPLAQTGRGRLVVIYRSGNGTANSERTAQAMGARSQRVLDRIGVSVMTVPEGQEQLVADRLRSSPEVEQVLEDRFVQGHALLHTSLPSSKAQRMELPEETAAIPVSPKLVRVPIVGGLSATPADAGYVSPAGWAVRAAGGYGAGVPGGPAVGPWNTGLGAGVRIALLDSGVDARHPDLMSNVLVNVSEVDQVALPSACDDGSAWDQEGHGTWAASLAAGALGIGTGEVIGVAAQATLINIKVLQRMPGAGTTAMAQCEAGQAGGLLSWVLTGINDAIQQKADVIVMSLGTIVDLTTGDGAGWKATFDRVTYAATQAGVVIVAAAGNDGLDLSGGRYAELPAQSRGVLAVTASTNPACAENLKTGAACAAGPVTRAYYSNHGIAGAVTAPGGSYPAGPDAGVSGWIRGACASGLPGTQNGLPLNGMSFGCFASGHTQYIQAMGTSAAAPLVAGGAALLRAAHREWTAEQVVAAIRNSATSLPGMAEPEVNLSLALAR